MKYYLQMIYPLNISANFLHNKNILITGGTGSFGNQMVKTLLIKKTKVMANIEKLNIEKKIG